MAEAPEMGTLTSHKLRQVDKKHWLFLSLFISVMLIGRYHPPTVGDCLIALSGYFLEMPSQTHLEVCLLG